MRANHTNARVRPAAVAGLFYPADPAELRETVSSYLAQAPFTGPLTRPRSLPTSAAHGCANVAGAWKRESDAPRGEVFAEKQPIAFIVPHAGYIYSGSIAAAAYSVLAAQHRTRRIVLIGPSHRVYLRGVSVPVAEAFATPLGDVPIDSDLKHAVAGVPHVIESDEPHRHEHSLEVQLPFLQVIFGEFTLLPLVAGEASGLEVAAILEAVFKEQEDVVVLASSDLSHYLPYSRAQQVDAETSTAILRREPVLTGHQACGAVPINGLLELARARTMTVQELARCNSGDTAGDRNRVVGYGAYALYET